MIGAQRCAFLSSPSHRALNCDGNFLVRQAAPTAPIRWRGASWHSPIWPNGHFGSSPSGQRLYSGWPLWAAGWEARALGRGPFPFFPGVSNNPARLANHASLHPSPYGGKFRKVFHDACTKQRKAIAHPQRAVFLSKKTQEGLCR